MRAVLQVPLHSCVYRQRERKNNICIYSYICTHIQKKNLLHSACVIHLHVCLVGYLGNTLSTARKLPELPSQKSPVFSDGGLDYWPGKKEARAKPSITALCSHIFVQVGFSRTPARADTLAGKWLRARVSE